MSQTATKLSAMGYTYIYLYELEVKHSHNVTNKNEKLKTDDHPCKQNKCQKITKWEKNKLIEN